LFFATAVEIASTQAPRSSSCPTQRIFELKKHAFDSREATGSNAMFPSKPDNQHVVAVRKYSQQQNLMPAAPRRSRLVVRRTANK
jgi:hypothetical protein